MDREETRHFIAPVCANCSGEIDKDAAGRWFHVTPANAELSIEQRVRRAEQMRRP